MNKFLISIALILSPMVMAIAQPCPGDIYVLEGENVEVWKVQVEGTQVLSLGAFQGSVNVGGNDYVQDESQGWWGLYVASHDLANGAYNWSQQIVGAGFFVTNPVMTTNGSTVMVSVTEGGGDGSVQALRIETFDLATGVPDWSKNYPIANTGSNLPFAAQVAPYDGGADAAANYYITGAFAGDLNLTVAPLSTGGSLSETFVFSLDQNGNELWAVQSTGSNGRGRAWTLEMNSIDEILIGGHFTGIVDFGGTSFVAADNTVVNPYLAKLSSVDGSASWVVGMEDTTPGSFNNIYDLTVDDLDNVYFSGVFNDGIDILGNGLVSAGGTDAMVGSLTTAGLFRWANQFGGVSTGSEFATTIVYGANTNSIFLGTYLQTDNVQYANVSMGLPATYGQYILGLSLVDGSIDANRGNAISYENTFGYSADYDAVNDKLVMASTSQGSGINVNIAQWIPQRPRAIVDVTLESGTLDPTETLTAFDPGGGVYTYQWYQDGVALGGEINPAYTATANGEYYVEVSSFPGGCAVNSESYFILDGSTLESDSLALVDLYNSTDGANWNDNTNWLNGDVSTWIGIILNGNRVSEIILNGNNLSGTLPQSIGTLQDLNNLDLGDNSISGSIPSSLYGLTNLNFLYLFNNSISGDLSPDFGNLINLRNLYLNDNSLTSTIPASFQNLVNLLQLGLSSNQLTGDLPPEIFNLTTLSRLYLDDNQLTGQVNSNITNLSNLEELALENNMFDGVFPDLTTLTNFRVLRMDNNEFSGDFPDANWQIPTLEYLNVGGNRELNVTLPSNLASLTQLKGISMYNTVSLKIPFPTDVYSLVNLESLDFGGHQMTGTLDAAIGNMTSLNSLWLWNNALEGDFPAEITSTALQVMSITGNNFTSFPDVSSLGMQQLELQYNLLGFDDVIPNLGIPTYTYAPQNRRPQVNDVVDEGGSLTLVNDYTSANNVYNWVFNQGDTISNAGDYAITGATVDDLGGYYCNISNPGVPDLTIATPFYNIAFSGAPRSWTVDNAPNSVANFKSFYAATYGTNDGDTIYVAGSAVPYEVGFSVYYTPRVIYGPGYFLADNPETQASAETAMINGGMGFRVGSEGSEVYGLDISEVVLNNQSSAIDDTLRNIRFTGNRIDLFGINDDSQNILIDKNYINYFLFYSTPAVGTSRSYQDIFINNNIIDTVTTFFAQATAARNDMVNVNFDRNTINVFLDSIQDATVSNNVINSYEATNNTESGTVSYTGASLANASGTLTVDNDFVSTTSVDAGAFSGSDPYVLSGIAPIPHIYGLTDIGRIRLDTQIKNETADDITKLSYVLGESGTIVEAGDVKSLEAGNPIDLLFRPRLGAVTPGATVDMMLWAEDRRGVKSVPQKLSFTAETTTVTGNVISSSGSAVDNGELLLFEINQEGAAFDTLATALNSQGQFTLSNIVIGDYLALANGDQTAFPDDLPTYFENIDLWEEADTILLDNTNASFDITLIARPIETTGQGLVTGVIEEEFDDETGGRIEGKRRIGGAGVSARRGRRSGRGEEEDTYELVAQVFSDENGEFEITGLPDDEYQINIQYPGFPMDETSNIDFEIGGDGSDGYDLVALVVDGQISVTLVSVTGLLEELVSSISVYPNPTSDNFIYIAFIDKENLDDGLVVGLYNMVGGLMVEKEIEKNEINAQGVFELPISALRKGSYIMTIKSGNEVVGDAKIILR